MYVLCVVFVAEMSATAPNLFQSSEFVPWKVIRTVDREDFFSEAKSMGTPEATVFSSRNAI